MQWLEVDGARDYIAQGSSRRPSRKVVYNMVAAGLKVARVRESGRRLLFCSAWIDEYLVATASPVTVPMRRRA